MASGDDYEVGYGRPPKHTRFKSGKSGNPSGRPKGSRNVSTILTKALGRKVRVRDGERVRDITVLDAAIERLTRQAAAGDVRSIKIMLELIQQTGGFGTGVEPPTEVLGEDDRAALDDYLARMGSAKEAS